LAPPKVTDNWQEEYLQASSNFSSIVSHGTLSSGSRKSLDQAIQRLHNTHILLVDEAHNFLNKLSNRSQEIAKSLAEYIILFTATPINRNREDLFRLIELLDIDNFPEEVIASYKEYAYKRGELSGKDLEQFQKVLGFFVVRRTKRELNAMIKKAPARYLNRLGHPCRYPEQNEHVYSLDESPEDIKIAEEINKHAEQLLGITRLQKLGNPRAKYLSDEEQSDYLRMRIRSAAGLSRHTVQDALRSSTAALLEHLYGTLDAATHFSIVGLPKNKETGDTIRNLRKLKDKLPSSNLMKVELPFWLRDREAYQQACEEELERYEKIGQLAKKLSLRREE